MAFVIATEDLASFRRCRRQWDFGGRERRNLVPVQPPAGSHLGQALREALDIYYFPGMWDWDRALTFPLVIQGFERAMAGQRATSDDEAWQRQLEVGKRLLTRYATWAPTVDGFSPVMVQPDFEVLLPDPARPEAGIVTPAGAAVRYGGRIDMLAVDASDSYWIVRHRAVPGDWPTTEELVHDEEAIAACWAWEYFYPGMTITGTIYNEFGLVPGSSPPPPATEPARAPAGSSGPARKPGLVDLVRDIVAAARDAQGGVVGPVRQHEASGGGRSVPQHRRLYAAAPEPKHAKRVVQHVGEGFRRTLVRRSPEELDAAWRRLAADASLIVAPDLTIEANPSDANCPPCPFRSPCDAMFAGDDAEGILRSAYRERPPVVINEGRLGGNAWGLGRGAAPVHFGDLRVLIALDRLGQFRPSLTSFRLVAVEAVVEQEVADRVEFGLDSVLGLVLRVLQQREQQQGHRGHAAVERELPFEAERGDTHGDERGDERETKAIEQRRAGEVRGQAREPLKRAADSVLSAPLGGMAQRTHPLRLPGGRAVKVLR